jgi:hypothetical protein
LFSGFVYLPEPILKHLNFIAMKKTVLVLMVTCLTLCYLNGFSGSLPLADSISVKFDEGSKFKLYIGDQTFDLMSYSINYSTLDARSLAANPFYVGSTVSLSIRTSKVDQTFLNWLFSQHQEEKSGKIVVYDGESGKEIKTILFTGLTTSSYSENGNAMANYNITPQISFGLRYKTINITLGK